MYRLTATSTVTQTFFYFSELFSDTSEHIHFFIFSFFFFFHFLVVCSVRSIKQTRQLLSAR